MTSDNDSGGEAPVASSFLQRAVGADAISRQVTRQGQAINGRMGEHFAALLDQLQRSALEERQRHAAQLEQLRHSAAEEAHRNATYLDQRMVEIADGELRALSATIDHVAQELHRTFSHIDERSSSHIDERSAAQMAHLHESLFEHRRLQNRAFSRDNLPSALAVKQYYLQLKASKEPFDFDEIGLSVFSQNNEDGILMYIFSRIGMKSKRCIEIGCDLSASTVGIPEGNTINLITNFGFDGLIVDIDPAKAAAIRHFFAQSLSTKHLHAPAHMGVPARYFSPAIVNREVTIENINAVFQDAGFVGEVDLLSIDVDSADVLMWDAVEAVSPRLMMIEINARIPFEQVLYGQASQSQAPKDTLEYQASGGSSLAAACEVAAKKGYEFIGMDATVLNAFFLRRDVQTQDFPSRRPSDYTGHRFNPLRHVPGLG